MDNRLTPEQKQRLEEMAVELRELFPDRFIRPLSIGQALLDLAAVSGSDAMVIAQTLLLECDARVARLAVLARDIRAKEPQALAMHGKLTQDQRDIFQLAYETSGSLLYALIALDMDGADWQKIFAHRVN